VKITAATSTTTANSIIANCQMSSSICIVKTITAANSDTRINQLRRERRVARFSEFLVNSQLEPQIRPVLIFLRTTDRVRDIVLSSFQIQIHAEPAIGEEGSAIRDKFHALL
jgi:hypothetical protein